MPRPGTVALVTCPKYPDLTSDDQLLAAALRDAGYDVAAVSWDAPDTGWERYDAVIIRSPWDYFYRVPEFLAWLQSLEGRPIRLFNPLATLRWNVRKTYLRDLEQRGIPIVPTHWVAQGSTESLRAICRQHAWTDIVIKPTYSGTAFGTWRAGPHLGVEEDVRLVAAASEREQMIQPFMPEIQTGGEYSVIFFGGHYSHTILKRPQRGDFRVQSDFGGSVERVMASDTLVAAARRVLEAAPTPCLYARVDCCLAGGQFLLMELEVLEPSLFFSQDRDSARRCVEALRGLI